MSSLQELYREVILDHYRNPRHRGVARAVASRPCRGLRIRLCGDEISLDLAVVDGTVTDLGVQRPGVLDLARLRASMMSDAVDREVGGARSTELDPGLQGR